MHAALKCTSSDCFHGMVVIVTPTTDTLSAAVSNRLAAQLVIGGSIQIAASLALVPGPFQIDRLDWISL